MYDISNGNMIIILKKEATSVIMTLSESQNLNKHNNKMFSVLKTRKIFKLPWSGPKRLSRLLMAIGPCIFGFVL